MQLLTDRYASKILGVLNCLDRVVITGTFPGICYAQGMTTYLYGNNIRIFDYPKWAVPLRDEIRANAEKLAADNDLNIQFVRKKKFRKEDRVAEIIATRGDHPGLVCILSAMESCATYRPWHDKQTHRTYLKPDTSQCLHYYFYFIDRDLGLCYLRVPTWAPFRLQFYVNGHEWLARALDRHGVDYTKIENAFVHIDDCELAQKLADDFIRLKWRKILNAFARRVNPLLRTLLRGLKYYWVIDQSEYATDIMFKDRPSLKDLYKQLERHAAVCFAAEDIMTFLGRKLNRNLQGEVVSDYKKRWPGARIKHRMKANWIKMYDKHGSVLRIETVINHPYEFPIRRWGIRNGQRVLGWYPMAKRVANLYRYAEVSLAANKRYIEALCVVDDPTAAYRLLDSVCEPVKHGNRRRRGLNPLRRDDVALFAATLRGEHFIRGFTNSDLAGHLGVTRSPDPKIRKRHSARITRLIQLLRAHGLIAKIPRSRRYRITLRGVAIMVAAIHLRDEAMTTIIKHLAA